MFDHVWSIAKRWRNNFKTFKNNKKSKAAFFFFGGVLFRLDIDCFNNQQSPWRSFLGATRKWVKRSGVLCEAIASSSAWLGWTAVVSSQGVTSWNNFHQGGWLLSIVNWWCGFLGSYEMDYYLRETLRIPNHHRAPNHQLIISWWLQWNIWFEPKLDLSNLDFRQPSQDFGATCNTEKRSPTIFLFVIFCCFSPCFFVKPPAPTNNHQQSIKTPGTCDLPKLMASTPQTPLSRCYFPESIFVGAITIWNGHNTH